ncbi:alpha/beta hydrolase [Alteromonadaceae bacterium M269]|nr:alpha/beta hydrolase [Alteromonadaceae bacterium M269]
MRSVIFKFFLVSLIFTLTACVSFPETPEEQRAFLEAEGDQVASFYFKGDDKKRLYMKGVIYGYTLRDIKQVLDANPQVEVLVMEEVPGSVDDEINLLASREIRKRNINTYIPRDGWVASGGTDMFLAGKERSADPSAKLGVHSWGGGSVAATDLPRNHSEHQKYLDYYGEMNIHSDFYWYTLDAAPAEDIHWMTKDEIKQYLILTH